MMEQQRNAAVKQRYEDACAPQEPAGNLQACAQQTVCMRLLCPCCASKAVHAMLLPVQLLMSGSSSGGAAARCLPWAPIWLPAGRFACCLPAKPVASTVLTYPCAPT